MTDSAHVSVSGAGRSATFQLAWQTPLKDLMTRACVELELAPADCELFCSDGTTMTNKLERTLGELREQRLCPTREFELRPT